MSKARQNLRKRIKARRTVGRIEADADRREALTAEVDRLIERATKATRRAVGAR